LSVFYKSSIPIKEFIECYIIEEKVLLIIIDVDLFTKDYQ